MDFKLPRQQEQQNPPEQHKQKKDLKEQHIGTSTHRSHILNPKANPYIPKLTKDQVWYMKCCDEVAYIMTNKPSPEGYELFCKKYGIENSTFLYV